MKITHEGAPQPRLYVSDTGGNPVLPNPDDPPPDPDEVDVALDSDAFVPIAPDLASAFIQEAHLATADTNGDWDIILDTPPTVGHVMVVGYTQRGWTGGINGGGTTISVSTDWTLIGVGTCGAFNGGSMAMWYKVVEFGDVGSFDLFKNASNGGAGWIAEFAMGALIDSDTDGPTGGSTSYSTPSLTRTNADQVFIAMVDQSTNQLDLDPDSSATLIFSDSVAGGTAGPTYVGEFEIGGPGALDMDHTSADAQAWGSVVALFASASEASVFVPAPLTVDGDDATFNESELEVVVRLDIGTAQRLISSRLLVGYDSAGSTTVHLWASNDPDMAGAVDVANETFTATGGGAPDEVLFTIADTTAYRYWEFRGPLDPTKTYTVEMFAFHTSFDLSGYQLLSEKDQPNGYAGLTSDGQVPDAELADGTATAGDVPTSNGDGTRTWGPAGGSASITVEEDGDSPITGVDHIVFAESGSATVDVVDDGGGQVTVTVGATGGGGGSLSVLGYNTAGGSHLSMGSFAVAKKVTLASTGCIVSVGAYIAMTSLASTSISVGVFADSSGPTGPLLAYNRAGGDSAGGLIADNNVPQWVDIPLGAYLPAGDYWVYWSHPYQGAFYELYYDGSGTDKELTPTDGIVFDEAIWRQSVASASRKYSLRAILLS